MRTDAPIRAVASDRWRPIFAPPLPHVEGRFPRMVRPHVHTMQNPEAVLGQVVIG